MTSPEKPTQEGETFEWVVDSQGQYYKKTKKDGSKCECCKCDCPCRCECCSTVCCTIKKKLNGGKCK